MSETDKIAGWLARLPKEPREAVREIIGRRDPEFLEWLDEDGVFDQESFTKMQSLLMDEALDSMGPDHTPTQRSMYVEGLGDVTALNKAQLF